MEITLLYYTSNREDESLEKKVRENILANKGDLPIISVSQKPIDFGENICVGEMENSYKSLFFQVKKGLEKITTPYVMVVEADCFYPPDYFKFRPRTLGNCYRYDNVWVNYLNSDRFYKKGFSHCAQCIDRKLWLDTINAGGTQIRTDKNRSWTGDPVVTIKSKKGVSRTTTIIMNEPPKLELPFWGKADNLY